MTAKVAIIKTGSTHKMLRTCFGDFERWFQTPVNNGAKFTILDAQSMMQAPSISEFDKYIITGSPQMVTDHAAWSEKLKPWLRDLVAHQIPLLAVCYGHQLLAEALGGKVDWHPKGREIGTVEIRLTEKGQQDPLLSTLPKAFKAHVTHAQSVIRLPPEAQLLAGNAFEPHHAFRIGSNAWGLQFHPEFTADIMRGYLMLSGEELTIAGRSIEALLSEVENTDKSRDLINQFVNMK